MYCLSLKFTYLKIQLKFLHLYYCFQNKKIQFKFLDFSIIIQLIIINYIARFMILTKIIIANFYFFLHLNHFHLIYKLIIILHKLNSFFKEKILVIQSIKFMNLIIHYR